MKEKPKIVVIVGATASGKSSLGISIAQKFNGEVISADSRQVYRKLDIGTAKLMPDEMQDVPHHLIDNIDIDTSYSAADFVADADAAIQKIVESRHLPIIVGGTFFYIDALLRKVVAPSVPPNPELRAYLEDLSTETLFRQLEELNPERAFTIDPHNKRRLVRALEIVHAVGKVPELTSDECPYTVLTIGLSVEKDELRSRYEARAQEWLSQGFREEVEGLLADGVSRDRLHEIGFEYQLMLAHIDGDLTKSEFIQRFVERNWQYAKRQLTWLKRDNTIQWFTHVEAEKIIERIHIFLFDQ